MVALFYFSHLFEIFLTTDDNVGDQKILIGEFLRAKDKLLSLPGVHLKSPSRQLVQVEAEEEEDEVQYIDQGGRRGRRRRGDQGLTLELWRAEFFKMDSQVSQNDYVCFHEFCQYAVRELVTPEQYLERYQKKAYDPLRPAYPPRYNPNISYSESLSSCGRVEKSKPITKAEIEVVLSPAQHKRKSTEQGLDNEKTIQIHIEDSNSNSNSNSASILFASRGRIRPATAPPPRTVPATTLLTAPAALPHPASGYALLKPTVFNGRDVLSNKKAQKKKYNTFHAFKLDPKMNSNFTRKNLPKRMPHPASYRGLPKRLLVPTSHNFSGGNLGRAMTVPPPAIIPNNNNQKTNSNHINNYYNEDEENRYRSSSCSTLAEVSRTLRLQVSLQSHLLEKPPMDVGLMSGSQPSLLCVSATDSVTMCDLSMSHH